MLLPDLDKTLHNAPHSRPRDARSFWQRELNTIRGPFLLDKFPKSRSPAECGRHHQLACHVPFDTMQSRFSEPCASLMPARMRIPAFQAFAGGWSWYSPQSVTGSQHDTPRLSPRGWYTVALLDSDVVRGSRASSSLVRSSKLQIAECTDI